MNKKESIEIVKEVGRALEDVASTAGYIFLIYSAIAVNKGSFEISRAQGLFIILFCTGIFIGKIINRKHKVEVIGNKEE